MSLKTQLALRLYERGNPQVADELRDLEGLIRISRKDLTQVVSGYREITLDAELRSARKVLAAAGVGLDVEGSVELVPGRVQETAAWFVREAVTNVIKHSRASLVNIRLSAAEIAVDNDGAPGRIGKTGGTGPLQQRAREVDGSIELKNRGGKFSAVLWWEDKS